MSNCRSVKHEKNFLIVEKEALLSKSLSFKAKGLWAYCMSLPSDWKYNIQHLSTVSKEGQRSIYTAIDELIAAGYCSRHQGHVNGGFGIMEYFFYETLSLNKCLPLCGFEHAGSEHAQNDALLRNQEESKEKADKQEGHSPPIKKHDRFPKFKESAAVVFSKEYFSKELEGKLSPSEFENGWNFFEAKAKIEKVKNPAGLILKSGKGNWSIPSVVSTEGANLDLIETLRPVLKEKVDNGMVVIGHNYVEFPWSNGSHYFNAKDKGFREGVSSMLVKMGVDISNL